MHLQLAMGHLKQGRHDAASELCLQLLEREPGNLDAIRLLLNIYGQTQDAEGVITTLRHARSAMPDEPSIRVQLGAALVDAGRLDEARAEYVDALKRWPQASEIHARLAGLTHFTERDAHVRAIETLHATSAVNSVQRRNFAFTLGKIFDDLNDFDAAFGFFQEGNDIARRASTYKIEADLRLFEDIKLVFDDDFAGRHASAASDSSLPIFVIGMPRTGTTLVEQILASHPDVEGAGELMALNNLIQAAGQESGDGFPAAFRQISSARLATIGAQYLDRLASLADGQRHVVNKNINLLLYVGVMLALFPSAPMIWCRRDPRDAAISLFKRDMPHQPYGYGLDLIGRFTRLFDDLMQHWTTIAPDRLIEVSYEALVSDPEVEVRNMLSRCGLPFAESCLRFHQSGRSVATASHLQVRQPMHNRSIGQWRRYEKFLGPLQAELDDG